MRQAAQALACCPVIPWKEQQPASVLPRNFLACPNQVSAILSARMFVHSAYVHRLKSDDCPDRTAHLRKLLLHAPLGSCCFSTVLLSIPALGSKLKTFTTRPVARYSLPALRSPSTQQGCSAFSPPMLLLHCPYRHLHLRTSQ